MITNLNELRAAHKRLVLETRQGIEASMKLGEEHAKFHVKHRAGFRHRTGRVARGTTGRIVRTRSGAVLTMNNLARHANFLEGGTRPHAIVAKRGRALRFVVGGQVMFRRRVWHPGTRPFHFMRNASDAAWIRTGVGLRRNMHSNAARF